MMRDKLGNIPVETRTGDWIVQNENGDCLVSSIDPWGKNKPEFDHPDFAGRFTEDQAREQVNFCWWSGNKIKTTAVRVVK